MDDTQTAREAPHRIVVNWIRRTRMATARRIIVPSDIEPTPEPKRRLTLSEIAEQRRIERAGGDRLLDRYTGKWKRVRVI